MCEVAAGTEADVAVHGCRRLLICSEVMWCFQGLLDPTANRATEFFQIEDGTAGLCIIERSMLRTNVGTSLQPYARQVPDGLYRIVFYQDVLWLLPIEVEIVCLAQAMLEVTRVALGIKERLFHPVVR